MSQCASFTDEKLWSKLPDGKVMHRKVLSDAIIQNFLETQIVCFEVRINVYLIKP